MARWVISGLSFKRQTLWRGPATAALPQVRPRAAERRYLWEDACGSLGKNFNRRAKNTERPRRRPAPSSEAPYVAEALVPSSPLVA